MPYPTSIARCQHVKVNGTQCGSPALHRRRFCWFHQQWRDRSVRVKANGRSTTFDLPVLEDANSVQITLMQVIKLILSGQIDNKTAGMLLYALQTASVNLRRIEFEPSYRERVIIDPRDVPDTPLGENAWDKLDFEEDEEEEEPEPDPGRLVLQQMGLMDTQPSREE
jgi:hypothetical protein